MTKSLRVSGLHIFPFFILLLGSCGPNEIDIESVNFYIIDNQSSQIMIYNTGSGLDERTIVIQRLDQVIIEEGRVYASEEPYPAIEFFRRAPGNEVYLLRKVDIDTIRTLKLSNSETLNWNLEKVGKYTYNHTLLVSYQMIE